MSKRKNLIEFDGKSIDPLPSLKKSQKSNQSSPRINTKAGSPKSILLNCEKKPGGSETTGGLLIKKFKEKNKKFGQSSALAASSLSPPGTKVEWVSILDDSLKLEEEESIPEKQKPVQGYLSGTITSNLRQNNFDFKRDEKKKDLFKDIEVANLKQKNSECLSYIDSLLNEIHSFKIKIKSLEEDLSRTKTNSQTSENTIKSLHNINKALDSKVSDLGKDLKFKENELVEMNELLRKSEDKRKVANEQMTDVESKLILFQRQIGKQSSLISELKKQLDTSKAQIDSQTIANINLTKNLSLLETELDHEKQKFNSTLIDLERSRQSLLSQIEELKLKQEKLKSENQRFQELTVNLQRDIKKNPEINLIQKRSHPLAESNFLANNSKEEAARWYSRCFKLEGELSKIKESLEKYEKNEEYYKSQLENKNLFIQKLEKIIENLEKSQKKVRNVE